LDPVDLGTIDTTDLAAIACWHILQGFLSGLSTLDADLKGVKDFNLWTESYGGHYGPSFYNYFQEQNAKITSGKMEGYCLNFATLGIGNGIIDEAIQAGWYPEFAIHNTYGIKAYNDTVYNYCKFANNMLDGCVYQIELCVEAAAAVNGGLVSEAKGNVLTNAAASNPSIATLCSEAADMCRDNVESPYYFYGGRGVYDIRHPFDDPTTPNFFQEYLNLPHVQEALGVVRINYTDANNDIYWHFQSTGDFIYPNFLADLENILDSGVRVSLYYGDADYICQ
jgi:carboxypeptidase C (cathepsin A)